MKKQTKTSFYDTKQRSKHELLQYWSAVLVCRKADSALLLPLCPFVRWHRDLLRQLVRYRQTGKGQDTQAGTLFLCIGITCRAWVAGADNTVGPLIDQGITYCVPCWREQAIGFTARPGIIPRFWQYSKSWGKMPGNNGNSACPCPRSWYLQMLLNGKGEGMTKLNGRPFRDAVLPAEELWAQGRVGASLNHCLLLLWPPDRILFWQPIWSHCTGEDLLLAWQ